MLRNYWICFAVVVIVREVYEMHVARFPMSLTGITITLALHGMLLAGHLKNHFYNTVAECPKMNDFHHAYCGSFPLSQNVC